MLFPIYTNAHTLPISDLTMVADEEYLHLELSLNPGELNFHSELAPNGPQQSARNEDLIARKIIEQIRVKVGNTRASPETVGIANDDGSHHLVLRAHYPLKNSSGHLQVESHLCNVTSASHFTQVIFRKGDAIQLAQLDSQTQTADFGMLKNHAHPLPATGTAPSTSVSAFFPMLLLLLPMALLLIAFLLICNNQAGKPRKIARNPASENFTSI